MRLFVPCEVFKCLTDCFWLNRNIRKCQLSEFFSVFNKIFTFNYWIYRKLWLVEIHGSYSNKYDIMINQKIKKKINFGWNISTTAFFKHKNCVGGK